MAATIFMKFLLHQPDLDHFQGLNTYNFSETPVPGSHHLHHKIFLSYIYSESLLVETTVLSLQVLSIRSLSSFIVKPFKHWNVLEGLPGTCSCPDWTSPNFSACLHRRGAQAHCHFQAPYGSCAEDSWAGSNAPVRVSWTWSLRGRITYWSLFWCFLGCKNTWPAHGQLFFHQYVHVLFFRAAFHTCIPHSLLVLWIASPGAGTCTWPSWLPWASHESTC